MNIISQTSKNEGALQLVYTYYYTLRLILQGAEITLTFHLLEHVD